jgi:hypothetical protein
MLPENGLLPTSGNRSYSRNLTVILPKDTMLPVAGNITILDNTLIREALRLLEGRLPAGWSLALTSSPPPDNVDATAHICAPDQRRTTLGVEAKHRLTPKAAIDLVRRLEAAKVPSPLVVSPFISGTTRAILRDGGVGFIDLTGNIRLVLSSPGLFIETTGAATNPEKEERSESLKGQKAGRVVRALIEHVETRGVRALAAEAGVDPGYVSRLFAFLSDEALVTRVGRGRLDAVKWPQLLERWAADAPLATRARVTTCIDPRGIPNLLQKLRSTTHRYAITGSFAASRIAPIAPPRLLSMYCDDLRGVMDDTGLRPTTTGANVQLFEPTDTDVFRGTTEKDGLRYVAVPIVVLDLLDGPGRAPAEAEELMAWMKKNEAVWRG